MTAACAACLRRSGLIGVLSGRISAVLGARGARSGLLALDEEALIAAVGGARTREATRFVECFDHARAVHDLTARGVGAVCSHTAGYPEALLDLDDPPAVLYFTGPAERLNRLVEGPPVAVVGTREASRYGLEVAHALGRGLAAAGVTVVSGLALGIDAAAHRGSLEGGSGGLAVLASGVDVPYPQRHRRLHERIRERGAVLSELPPGHLAHRWSFPARNRIMAALGPLTVVVEAAELSGSLITAGFAADLGREVAAVPGQVTSRRAEGSNRLLRDGAAPVRGAEDVLDDLFGVGTRPGRAASASPAAPELDPVLRRVLDAVEAGEGVERIGVLCRLEPGAVRAALGRLEQLGLVVRDGLGGYARSGQRESAPMLG